MDLELSDRELERYSRQLVLPEFGVEAQLKLKQARAVVVGAGALGSPAAGYLVAAGVGYVGVIDPDRVELSNLQRQVLHFDPDLGANKAESLTSKLGLLNPEIIVESYPARLEQVNCEALLAGNDIVLDCCDNFETRYLVNSTCMQLGIPLVESGVAGLLGLVTSIVPGQSSCYQCMFPDNSDPVEEESCREAGIVGPLAGTVGSLMAVEAIKLLTGLGEPLLNRVLQIDGATMSFTTVQARRDPACAACGQPAPEPPRQP